MFSPYQIAIAYCSETRPYRLMVERLLENWFSPDLIESAMDELFGTGRLGKKAVKGLEELYTLKNAMKFDKVQRRFVLDETAVPRDLSPQMEQLVCALRGIEPAVILLRLLIDAIGLTPLSEQDFEVDRLLANVLLGQALDKDEPFQREAVQNWAKILPGVLIYKDGLFDFDYVQLRENLIPIIGELESLDLVTALFDEEASPTGVEGLLGITLGVDELGEEALMTMARELSPGSPIQ